MLCNNCGRESVQEESNYCFYCGESFREHRQEVIEAKKDVVVAPESTITEKPVSVWNWLGSYGVLLIPVVGYVILLIWAFDKKTNKNKKTWARATLIVLLLMLLYLIVTMNMLQTDPRFQEYFNGNIDINQLMYQIWNVK